MAENCYCGMWKGFKNYQHFAHHITSAVRDKAAGKKPNPIMDSELQGMLDAIVMSGDAIKEVSVAWNGCSTNKIALKIIPAEKEAKIMLVSFMPDWMGVAFARQTPNTPPIQQLKAWLLSEVGA